MPSRRGVRRTYDRIASHFAETRPHPWSEVEAFLDGRSGGLGVDLGCGNGRHAEVLAEHAEAVLALDASRGCLATADARATGTFEPTLLQGDVAHLPLRDGRVDLAIYVATLHHLPDREQRIGSLDELARVLSADGSGIVSAWSVSHDTFDRTEAFDTTVDWTLPDGETVPRFYHVYDREEFRADLERSAVTVGEVFESHGNCWGVVES